MLRILLQPIQRTIQAILTGGRAGQILAKRSNADNDVEWIDIPAGTVVVDHELDSSSNNAVSNHAVADQLTWHTKD